MKKSTLVAAMAVVALCAPSVSFAGDAAKGAKKFNLCKACHTVETTKNKIGPTLNGIVGKKAAAVAGYEYSVAMKKAGAEGLVWDEANLDKFLEKPRKMIKGTKMGFAGMRKAEDRANLIEYLKSVPVAK